MTTYFELSWNEGNIIRLSFDTSSLPYSNDSTEVSVDEIFNRFRELTEKWGSLSKETDDNIVVFTINDADLVKTTKSWEEDFSAFAAENKFSFIGSYIPYVDAANNAVSYEFDDEGNRSNKNVFGFVAV